MKVYTNILFVLRILKAINGKSVVFGNIKLDKLEAKFNLRSDALALHKEE